MLILFLMFIGLGPEIQGLVLGFVEEVCAVLSMLFRTGLGWTRFIIDDGRQFDFFADIDKFGKTAQHFLSVKTIINY